MTYMFQSAEATELIGISNWDLSSAGNIGGMFSKMPNITAIDITGWDTSHVTNINSLFNSVTNLTTIYASESFTISHVTSTGKVFDGSSNLVGGNNTHYDSSNVYRNYAKIDGLDGTEGYFTQGPRPTV